MMTMLGAFANSFLHSRPPNWPNNGRIIFLSRDPLRKQFTLFKKEFSMLYATLRYVTLYTTLNYAALLLWFFLDQNMNEIVLETHYF
jgi:hypothetical protein